MSDGSMIDTRPSCPNGGCASPLSRHSVDLLQRRHSTPFPTEAANEATKGFGGARALLLIIHGRHRILILRRPIIRGCRSSPIFFWFLTWA
jgi:hypothetical protein